MTPAALLLTILFVAEDPDVGAVVVEVVEDGAGRHADVVVVRAGVGVSASINGPRAEGSRRLRDWPLPPPGASFTPAVDGLVISFDEVGDWQLPLPSANGAPDPKAKKPTRSRSCWPIPSRSRPTDSSSRPTMPSVCPSSAAWRLATKGRARPVCCSTIGSSSAVRSVSFSAGRSVHRQWSARDAVLSGRR